MSAHHQISLPVKAASLDVYKPECAEALRRLQYLKLTTTEARLARTLALSSPYPVSGRDLASATSGNPVMDSRRQAVLEQQISRLRSRLIAHGLHIFCVESYGYLLLLRDEP